VNVQSALINERMERMIAMLRVREMNEYDQFVELRKPWKHYGKERELRILLAEDGEKIVAIALLMYSIFKLFTLRLGKMEFLWTQHTDYRNLFWRKSARLVILKKKNEHGHKHQYNRETTQRGHMGH